MTQEAFNNKWINSGGGPSKIETCASKPADVPIGSPEFNAAKLFENEIKDADQKINEKVRQADNISVTAAMYRSIGMLGEVVQGSWEETTLVHLIENQRLMVEC